MDKGKKIEMITSAMRGDVQKLRQLIYGDQIAVIFKKPEGEIDFVMFNHRRYSPSEWEKQKAKLFLSQNKSTKINFQEAI